MPELTVLEAEHKADKPDNGYGPMQVISLTLRDEMDQTKQAEWYTGSKTPVPQPGAKLFGSLEASDWGLKFKKDKGAFNNAGGGGFKPRDPKESARITRMHSQEMSIRWAAIAQARGKLPDDFTIDSLKRLIDWFQLDVELEPQRYGVEKRKDTTQTGASDVPAAGDQDFVHLPQSGSGTPFDVSS